MSPSNVSLELTIINEYPSALSCNSKVFDNLEKKGFSISGIRSPNVLFFLVTKLRAAAFGIYWLSSAICRIRFFFFSEILFGLLFKTRDTLLGETPANLAISFMVMDIVFDLWCIDMNNNTVFCIKKQLILIKRFIILLFYLDMNKKQ